MARDALWIVRETEEESEKMILAANEEAERIVEDAKKKLKSFSRRVYAPRRKKRKRFYS